MTSLESMAAAQIAAFQRLPELNQMNPFYPSRFLKLKLRDFITIIFVCLSSKSSVVIDAYFVASLSEIRRHVFSTISSANIALDDTRSHCKSICQNTDECRSSSAFADSAVKWTAARSQRKARWLIWRLKKRFQVSFTFNLFLSRDALSKSAVRHNSVEPSIRSMIPWMVIAVLKITDPISFDERRHSCPNK